MENGGEDRVCMCGTKVSGVGSPSSRTDRQTEGKAERFPQDKGAETRECVDCIGEELRERKVIFLLLAVYGSFALLDVCTVGDYLWLLPFFRLRRLWIGGSADDRVLRRQIGGRLPHPRRRRLFPSLS